MSNFTIREVTTAAEARLFITMAPQFYTNDPNYVRPLDQDIAKVFDPNQNKILKDAPCARFLLFSESHCVGRIAVFINPREAHKQVQPTGGMGFFECVNNREAAHMLFDTARDWLKERGMEAMDGPVNLGERIRFWGLMVEGFVPPVYGLSYNPPYYRDLIESYGFENYHEQYCFEMTVSDQLSPSFYKRHERLKADPAYRAEHIRKKDLIKYARDFATIYNEAWAGHGGGKQISEEQVIREFKTMKTVMDERLSWFVYHNNRPVAFWINLPEINEIFKHFNGRLGLWQKLRFLYMKWKGTCTLMYGVAFGVVPEYQGKGVESFMIIESEPVIRYAGYNGIEIQWIHEKNPKMLRVIQFLQARKKRTLVTYRYLFDRSKPFERHPTF
jgi:GNAT superfamily N-acetyltransferase